MLSARRMPYGPPGGSTDASLWTLVFQPSWWWEGRGRWGEQQAVAACVQQGGVRTPQTTKDSVILCHSVQGWWTYPHPEGRLTPGVF